MRCFTPFFPLQMLSVHRMVTLPRSLLHAMVCDSLKARKGALAPASSGHSMSPMLAFTRDFPSSVSLTL